SRAHWTLSYSSQHGEGVMRRAPSLRRSGSTLITMPWFKVSSERENSHPVESGLFRLKSRRDRRPTLAIEPIWTFYPKFLSELVYKTVGWAAIYLRLRKIYVKIKHDPRRREYSDLAITPVTDDEIETHEMFKNEAARAYVDSERRLEKIRQGAAA